jgi:hypothetical protein
MLSKSTTFVIGSGASCEFNLPDGPKLIGEIAKALDIRWDDMKGGYVSGDSQIAETFRRLNEKGHAWQQACWRIRDGLPGLADSIDSYLDNHRADTDMQRVGRAAIVKCILAAEEASKLKLDAKDRMPRLDCARLDVADTWIGALFRTLQRRCDIDGVRHFFTNCNMIVFNYDRCIEHYLEHALSQAYHIPLDEARKIVCEASIIHVYGSVGLLPGYTEKRDQCVEFGSTAVNLIEVSQRIRTYTDQMSDDRISRSISNFMDAAEVLVFLGFAFHPQNLDLLHIRERRHNPLIIGTAYQVSQYNRDRYVENLKRRYSPGGAEPQLADMKCAQLMRDFSGAFDR